jgi:hypothetical protein
MLEKGRWRNDDQLMSAAVVEEGRKIEFRLKAIDQSDKNYFQERAGLMQFIKQLVSISPTHV